MAISVMAVDDSALVRKFISESLANAADIRLVETASDPLFAIEKLKKVEVDVIILDIEMPRMDGISFLKSLMETNPLPVIMFSSLTERSADISLKALELGAFSVMAKPEFLLELEEKKGELLAAIRAAGTPGVREKLLRRTSLTNNALLDTEQPVSSGNILAIRTKTTDKVVAIGSSTGGTMALDYIFQNLSPDMPGIVVVQHMPNQFIAAFTRRLDAGSRLRIKIAENGEWIHRGTVYISPGDRHCSVAISGAKYHIKLREGPPVNYHRPSVTVLFNSMTNFVGANAIGIMLTGMGTDGAKAMKSMKNAGSFNIIQDEASSVVWGMPGKAAELGAGQRIVPLEEIPGVLSEYTGNMEDYT